MTARILGIVTTCKECPHRSYYSSGVHECVVVRKVLDASVSMPAWCPLPLYPVTDATKERT